MTRERSGVYIWVTWLSKLMAGEANCQWAAWFKAHHTDYGQVPGDFQLAAWTAEHTQLLDEVSKERAALGESIFREDQNSFRAHRLVAGDVHEGCRHLGDGLRLPVDQHLVIYAE